MRMLQEAKAASASRADVLEKSVKQAGELIKAAEDEAARSEKQCKVLSLELVEAKRTYY